MSVTGRAPLAHVRWLGGSACAGKSSVARLLAARHGLAVYSCDEGFEDHRRRATPASHPAFSRLMDLPPEELFARPADVLARELLAFYEDEMEMVAEDLMAAAEPTLAEGVGLLPHRLAEWHVPPQRAVWLLSTPAFREAAYPGRGSWVEDLLRRCPDPAGARTAWRERDTRVAEVLQASALGLGLPVLTVDGRRGVEQVADDVALRLGLRGS